MVRSRIAWAGAVAVLLLWGATHAAAGARSDSVPPPAVGCHHVAWPAPRHGTVPRPSLQLARRERATITLHTNCGSITIRLATWRAPRTASSVAGLVQAGYYDGLTFHRVARDFVIQGGDPHGDGTGGPGWSVVERPPGHLVYRRGIVGMAKTVDEPDGTSGSQFFIVTTHDARLPPMYAVLGRVTAGMGTVDRIAALRARGRSDGPPRRAVVISRATLQRHAGGPQ